MTLRVRVRVRNGIFHSHSRSRKLGMEFPGNLHFRKLESESELGMEFFTPVPKTWEWNFPGNSLEFVFPKVGMEFSTPITVPETWEWNFLVIPGNFYSRKSKWNFLLPFSFQKLKIEFPFPFPKFGNVICRSRSQSPKVIPAHPCITTAPEL